MSGWTYLILLEKKFLVCIVQWSGYPMYQRLHSTTTASILNVLSGWFNLLCWPCLIRCDGGPQFRVDFAAFFSKNDIWHELSSPYNPRSNGWAKSAVKTVKTILKKCLADSGDPEHVLCEWGNFPRNHGHSPAQLMFGRRQRNTMPMPDSAFSQVAYQRRKTEKLTHRQTIITRVKWTYLC